MLLHEIALVVIIFYEALNCDGEMRPLYLPLTFSPAGAPAPAPAAAIPQGLVVSMQDVVGLIVSFLLTCASMNRWNAHIMCCHGFRIVISSRI
ncbi:uncharacterized protein [Setaria viridis]|uniref:uncharacterized protein n=1 Tax=Setaria viridis TaxID=4556 RepID=UPI003B3B5ED0